MTLRHSPSRLARAILTEAAWGVGVLLATAAAYLLFPPIGATMLFAGAAAGLGSVAAIVDGVRWNRSGRVSR